MGNFEFNEKIMTQTEQKTFYYALQYLGIHFV